MSDPNEILHCVQNDKVRNGKSSPTHLDAMPRVGVSACLLGQNTRYDGGNRLDPAIAEIIGAVAEIVPICPEMEIGMGAPRPPIRLVDSPGGLRARGVDDPAIDVTDALDGVGRVHSDLSGLILKNRSPSCGTGNTEVFSQDGKLVSSAGFGIFALSIMGAAPLLPVEDETVLHDRMRRNIFLLRLFVYDCWTHMADRVDEPFGWFAGETGFIVNALEPQVRQKLESITVRIGKDSGPTACAEYVGALLSALTSSPPEGTIHHVAGIAISLLSKRKRAGGLQTTAQESPSKPKRTL
ncbi:MAG: DUF523 domain-containing protein [Nitrospinae bacterium]|nr:DUF523 domain-containing protein [Nitrospinota bacterium]